MAEKRIFYRPIQINDTLTVKGALTPLTSDGAALGSVSLMYSDLFLASGGVINFNNGDVTLTHSTDRVKFASSAASANFTDGIGAWEVDLTLTGTTAGHNAAASAWVNIVTGTVSAGNYVCARNDGIYEATGGTVTNALLIFGARMHYLATDTDGLRFPFSLNTNNAAITAFFDLQNLTDAGMITDAGSDSGTLVPFMRDAAGTVKYLKLYDQA